jgi:phage tail sheath protein FI
MAALLHPGVYVQEVPGGARSIEGVPTATTIIAGETEFGPFEPTKIRGPAEYARLFGGHLRHSGTSESVKVTTRYAADLFFQNGGTSAYILRTSTNASVAVRNLTVAATTTPALPAVTADFFKAASPGQWGAHIFVIITHRGDDRFRVTIYYQAPPKPPSTTATDPAFVEDFDQLTLKTADASFVGDVLKRSQYVRWLDADATPQPQHPQRPPADAVPAGANILDLAASLFQSGGALDDTVLVGGGTDDFADNTDLVTILPRLDGVDDAALFVGATERWLEGGATPFANDPAAIEAYYDALFAYVNGRPKLDLFLVADAPSFATATSPIQSITGYVLGINTSTFTGLYWPHLEVTDPVGIALDSIARLPPSAAVAGLFARTDNRRGVWKAPAGVEAGVAGIVSLTRFVIDGEQDDLNPIGINAIRSIPGAGTVVWGSRTLVPNSEWRYVPVRRTAMFLRKSIFNGIQFAVFEPNDEPLWSTLRATIGAFMNTQFRNGAFAGATAKDAFFVKVDKETTTPDDQAAGVVNILVGFAPLRPAEFVVVRLSQKTASSA